MTVIDADGHVTESTEQVVKYMDAPFRNRQLVFPIVPADGWDRRLITKFHDTAATADAWLRALDKGGMEQAVLFPTLGLFMSFIKDRTWAVQFCRAYNTLMHEEFITASPRLRAVALLPIQDPEAAAEELELADRAPELLRRSLGVLDRQEGDGSETRARRDELLVHEGVVRAAELHRPGAILDEAHEEPERREEHRLLHAALVERPEPGVGGRGGVVELRDEPPVPAVGRNDREDELPVAERRVHVLHHLLGGLGHV